MSSFLLFLFECWSSNPNGFVLEGPEQLSFGNFISESLVVVYIARYPVTGNESN